MSNTWTTNLKKLNQFNYSVCDEFFKQRGRTNGNYKRGYKFYKEGYIYNIKILEESETIVCDKKKTLKPHNTYLKFAIKENNLSLNTVILGYNIKNCHIFYTNSLEDLKKMEQNIRNKIDQACRTAEEFTKLYYESVDKRRHLMARLYLDNGILVWNGNGTVGNERIQKFFMELPPSDHMLTTLDAQPIMDSAVGGQTTFLIQVSGTVKFQNKTSKSFQQNFMVTAEGNKWKIVSDCLRLQEPIQETKDTK